MIQLLLLSVFVDFWQTGAARQFLTLGVRRVERRSSHCGPQGTFLSLGQIQAGN
jgi:hypothetical protein